MSENTENKSASKVAAKATSGAKVGKAAKPAAKKAAAAKPAKAKKAASESTRARIDVHANAVAKALASKSGATVDEQRDALGICRRSVRKLFADAKAKKGEDGRYHAR